MKKLALITVACAMAMPFAATPALADGHEAGKPELLKQEWYRINLMRFKEGKQGRANEIIGMFNAASKAAGQDGPIAVHMNTGPWHIMAFFEMKHGVAALGWANDPDGEAWDKAFQEIAGGEDKAREIWMEFNSLIAQRERHLGHIHDDGKDEG